LRRGNYVSIGRAVNTICSATGGDKISTINLYPVTVVLSVLAHGKKAFVNRFKEDYDACTQMFQ
jgi:hypothetical protein